MTIPKIFTDRSLPEQPHIKKWVWISVVLFLIFAIPTVLLFIKDLERFKKPPSQATVITQGAAGKIVIAPTCAGPGKPGEICSEPFQGTVIVKDKKKQKEVTRFTTGTGGTFLIALQTGMYIFEPITKAGIPGWSKQFDVIVVEGKVTPVAITIDTGIR